MTKKELMELNINSSLLAEGEKTDIPIYKGDIITVPTIYTHVSVIGEVVAPGTFEYTPLRSALYYIGIAKGFNEKAYENSVKIINSNGEKKISKLTTIIEPGDTVIVSADFFKSMKDYVGVVSQGITTIYLIWTMMRAK